MTEIEQKYIKLELALKYYLVGKGYHRALAAFALAKECHYDDLRKDNVTRVFQHQIEICLQLITLKDLQDEEDVLIVALLHDAYEDDKVAIEVIRQRFGDRITEAIIVISKCYDGVKKSTESYYHEVGKNHLTAPVKGCDRCHNLKTMIGVFTRRKQYDYVVETRDHTLPMLKEAMTHFPQMIMTFQNIRQTLKLTTMLVEKSFTEAELEEFRK